MKNRRDNIHWVIKVIGTQKDVADLLNNSALTQPILSSIVRGKRLIYDGEARALENDIGIPAGWLDEPSWVKDGWKLIKEYQLLDNSSKEMVNKCCSFVSTKRT